MNKPLLFALALCCAALTLPAKAAITVSAELGEISLPEHWSCEFDVAGEFRMAKDDPNYDANRTDVEWFGLFTAFKTKDSLTQKLPDYKEFHITNARYDCDAGAKGKSFSDGSTGEGGGFTACNGKVLKNGQKLKIYGDLYTGGNRLEIYNIKCKVENS